MTMTVKRINMKRVFWSCSLFRLRQSFNMAALKFEGFIDGIKSSQLEFIEKMFNKLGYREGTVKVASIGKVGDNYTTDVRRFAIEKDGKLFKIVAKIASGNGQSHAALGMNNNFLNEQAMYTTVLPKYSELEEAAGIPYNKRFKYAKCYGVQTEVTNEVILLEDLQERGFKLLDKFTSLPNEAVLLILKDFAAMHALSYAWKALEPRVFKENTSKLFNIWDKEGSVMQQLQKLFANTEKDALDILQDEKYKKYVRNFAYQFNEMIDEPQTKDYEKYHIIQQGDPWTNNIMFCVENGKPTQSCMVDYQLSRLTSPIVDLGYFIFNCTDHKMRMKHFSDWMDYYYSKLDEYLSCHGLKADEVYPRERFDKEWKDCGKLTMLFGILIGGVIMRDGDDAEKLRSSIHDTDNTKELFADCKLMNPETIEKVKTRIEEVIDSHLELGLISTM